VSEIERHWVIVPATVRKYFPPCNIAFEVKIGGKHLDQTYIDRYNRLRLGARLFDKLDAEPGCSIIFAKGPEKTYVLKKKES